MFEFIYKYRRLFWTLAAIGMGIMIFNCNRGTITAPSVYTDGLMQVLWRGPDQVELTWDDMPVTVIGGSEDYVWTRSASLELPMHREPVRGDSFMGFDRGDVVEAEVAIYGGQGRVIYRRSLHKEEGDPDSYEAYWPLPYSGPPTKRLTVDLTCRVNGKNQFDELSARCHFAAIVTFAPEE